MGASLPRALLKCTNPKRDGGMLVLISPVTVLPNKYSECHCGVLPNNELLMIIGQSYLKILAPVSVGDLNEF